MCDVSEKPHIPLLVVSGCVLLFLLVRWIGSLGTHAETQGRGASAAVDGGRSRTDWSRVAIEIIQQKERAGLPGKAPPAETAEHEQTAVAADAPLVYRVNYQRSGYVGGPSPTGLSLLWEYREDDTMVLSSPLVSGKFVYCATAYLDPPSTYGSIFCLDAATGRKVWETFLKSPSPEIDFKGFFSSPALTADGEHLLIGQGLHADGEAELICLEAATGRVRWLVPTPLHIESSPAIEGDTVVAGAGAIETGSNHKPKGDPKGRGHPGYVFGTSIVTGKELWRFPVIDPESSPAIHGGIAFIGSGLNGAGIVALGIAEGLAEQDRLVWKTDTPFPATGSVTLHGDTVLVGCGNGDFVYAAPNPEGAVLALDRTSGDVRWSAPMPDAVLGPLPCGRGSRSARSGTVRSSPWI